MAEEKTANTGEEAPKKAPPKPKTPQEALKARLEKLERKATKLQEKRKTAPLTAVVKVGDEDVTKRPRAQSGKSLRRVRRKALVAKARLKALKA